MSILVRSHMQSHAPSPAAPGYPSLSLGALALRSSQGAHWQGQDQALHLWGRAGGGCSLCGERHFPSKSSAFPAPHTSQLSFFSLGMSTGGFHMCSSTCPMTKGFHPPSSCSALRSAPALAECPDRAHPVGATQVSHRPPPQLALLLG